MTLLLLALAAMFTQQTFVTIARILPAVIAPAIITDLQFDPAWVGAYFGLNGFAALLFQLGCGSFIVRYGAMRISQASLVMLAAGIAVTTGDHIILFALSAIVCGGGAAVSTPSSSHLLGRYAPERYAPLIFSIKQTAVPAGLLMTGFLGPALTVATGWRGAMLIGAAACILLAIALEPLRGRFDTDRVTSHAFHLSDLKHTIRTVLKTGDLRSLAFACFAFNAVQSVVTAYFVIYLTTLGYTLAAAGSLFSLAIAVAMPGRVLWGWLGSVYIAPRIVLAGLGFGMAVSAVVVALYGPDWPALWIGLGAAAMSATALSWHGILLSETARLAPGMRGAATGGVLAFGQFGATLMPLVYSGLLGLTGNYGVGFLVCAIPAVIVGIDLLLRHPKKPDPDSQSKAPAHG